MATRLNRGHTSARNNGRLAGILVTTLILVPALALIVLTRASTRPPDELVLAPEALYSTPTRVVSDDQQAATITLDFAPGESLLSTGRPGIVTESLLVDGAVFHPGGEVLRVDGAIIRGIAGEAPLHRNLSFDMHGPDVRQMQTFLAELGFLDASYVDGAFGKATYAAVCGYEQSIGVEPTGTFRTDYVVWLPETPFVVASSSILIGAPAPPLGTILASAQATVRGAALKNSSGANLNLDAPYEVLADGEVIGIVGADGLVPADVTELATVLERVGSANGSPDTDTLGSEQSSGRPANAALAVTIRREVPREATAVPTSAVMAGDNGSTFCVWVRDGVGHMPVAVTIVGGTMGVTELEDLPQHDDVLVNPARVMGDPSCP